MSQSIFDGTNLPQLKNNFEHDPLTMKIVIAAIEIHDTQHNRDNHHANQFKG